MHWHTILWGMFCTFRLLERATSPLIWVQRLERFKAFFNIGIGLWNQESGNVSVDRGIIKPVLWYLGEVL